MNPTKKSARYAGWLYLLLAITGFVSIMYIPSQIIVVGDAAATADNIRSSEGLFRTGIFVGLISNIFFIFLVVALYRLLREINPRQAMLMLVLVMASATLGFFNTLNQVAALIVLSGAEFLSVFDPARLEALSYLFLRLNSQSTQAIQVFWGLWLFPFGLLVYRSRFIPRILGVLLFIAGSGYVLSFAVSLLLPLYKAALLPFLSSSSFAAVPRRGRPFFFVCLTG